MSHLNYLDNNYNPYIQQEIFVSGCGVSCSGSVGASSPPDGRGEVCVDGRRQAVMVEVAVHP